MLKCITDVLKNNVYLLISKWTQGFINLKIHLVKVPPLFSSISIFHLVPKRVTVSYQLDLSILLLLLFEFNINVFMCHIFLNVIFYGSFVKYLLTFRTIKCPVWYLPNNRYNPKMPIRYFHRLFCYWYYFSWWTW